MGSIKTVITVAGLGPGDFGSMTIDSWEAIRSARRLVLRTAVHPTVEELRRRGVEFEALDYLYEAGSSFDQVYEMMAERLVEIAREIGQADGERRDEERGEERSEELGHPELVYAVPGSPTLGERSVEILKQAAAARGLQVRVLSGASFLEPFCRAASVDIFSGAQIIDAMELHRFVVSPTAGLIVPQVYNRMMASTVKTYLMDIYPDDHQVLLVVAAGTAGETVHRLPLYAIDQDDYANHLSTLYVPPLKLDLYGVDLHRFISGALKFAGLLSIMAQLRSPNGCPWDREQTHQSLKKYMVEETYEALDAIDEERMDKLVEELGDVLLQVVFHAEVASDSGEFTIDDVIDSIGHKLVRRHPHVFGDVHVDDSAAVLRNWEKIKAKERGDETRFASAFDSVPRKMPALMRADRIQSKASRVGFDWGDASLAFAKVKEELAELETELSMPERDMVRLAGELGDLLFSIVNVSRLLKIDPEDALTTTITKFMRRFRYMEERAIESGRQLDRMSLAEMDALWDEAKVAIES